jgi:hypothetical protein
MSLKARAAGVSVLFAASALGGCIGTAVSVAQSPGGGVIELDGDRAAAMADARRLMSERCGGAYTILGAEDEVVLLHRGEQIQEFRVRYACGAQPERAAPAR